MINKTELLHSEIEIYGRVQMVGFRNIIKNFADVNNLVGKIWNDKQNNKLVHVICEGDEKDIKKFYDWLKQEKQQTQKNKKLRDELPGRILEIDRMITSMKKTKKKDPNKLLKILELEKGKIELQKQLRVIKDVPLPEVNDYSISTEEEIEELSFKDFKTGIYPDQERMEIGVQQLIQSRIENAGNLNFDLMNKNFGIMDVKYDRISESLKGFPKDFAIELGKVLEQHDERLIKILKPKP
ncbi:MAG: acylphosphatase [Methanocellales archaeon]|nr:acylphosphatase [Methanocellales archaeon]